MKEFIDINARKVAKNDFEKDFYKGMSNSVFGKTMENVRNREDIEIFNDNEESDRKKLKTHFQTKLWEFYNFRKFSLGFGKNETVLDRYF